MDSPDPESEDPGLSGSSRTSTKARKLASVSFIFPYFQSQNGVHGSLITITAGSIDVGDGSGVVGRRIRLLRRRIRLNPHLHLRHSKSLTSQAPLGGLALVPIQRLPRIALRRSGLPGQNDRRYSNRRAASRPGPCATRQPARPLSPEGHSVRISAGART